MALTQLQQQAIEADRAHFSRYVPPLVNGFCNGCQRDAFVCASCGGLRCLCPTPWSGGHHQHYDARGVAYRLLIPGGKGFRDSILEAEANLDFLRYHYEKRESA